MSATFQIAYAFNVIVNNVNRGSRLRIELTVDPGVDATAQENPTQHGAAPYLVCVSTTLQIANACKVVQNRVRRRVRLRFDLLSARPLRPHIHVRRSVDFSEGRAAELHDGRRRGPGRHPGLEPEWREVPTRLLVPAPDLDGI